MKEYATTGQNGRGARARMGASTKRQYLIDATAFEAACLDGGEPRITKVMEDHSPRQLMEHWARLIRDCFDPRTGPAYRRREIACRRAKGVSPGRNAEAAAMLDSCRAAERELSLRPRREALAACKQAEMAMGIF